MGRAFDKYCGLFLIVLLAACECQTANQSPLNLHGRTFQLNHPNISNSQGAFNSQAHSNTGGGSHMEAPVSSSPRSSGPLSIDGNGFLQGPNVYQQINNNLRASKFPAGDPRVIVLHKTAGRSCNVSNGKVTVPKGYEKPHVYICRDGSIVVNGSLDYARRRAEAGHNHYTLNIELEASYVGKSPQECAAKGIKIPEKALHCYENLTAIQAERTKQVLAAFSQHANIPLIPVLPGSQYYDHDTFISATTNMDSRCDEDSCSMNDQNRARGVASSHQTRLAYNDSDNHDDHMSAEDAKAIGIPELVRGNYSFATLAAN